MSKVVTTFVHDSCPSCEKYMKIVEYVQKDFEHIEFEFLEYKENLEVFLFLDFSQVPSLLFFDGPRALAKYEGPLTSSKMKRLLGAFSNNDEIELERLGCFI